MIKVSKLIYTFSSGQWAIVIEPGILGKSHFVLNISNQDAAELICLAGKWIAFKERMEWDIK